MSCHTRSQLFCSLLSHGRWQLATEDGDPAKVQAIIEVYGLQTQSVMLPVNAMVVGVISFG